MKIPFVCLQQRWISRTRQQLFAPSNELTNPFSTFWNRNIGLRYCPNQQCMNGENYDSIIQIYNKLRGTSGGTELRLSSRFNKGVIQCLHRSVARAHSSSSLHLLLLLQKGLYQPLLVFTVLHMEVLPPKRDSNLPNNGPLLTWARIALIKELLPLPTPPHIPISLP